MPVACQPRVREAQHGGDARRLAREARRSPTRQPTPCRARPARAHASRDARAAAPPAPASARTAARRRAGRRARRRPARPPGARASRASSSSPAMWPWASLKRAHAVQVEERERRRRAPRQQLPEVVEQRAPVAEPRQRSWVAAKCSSAAAAATAVGAPQLDLGHRRAREVLEHAVVAAGPLARLVVDRAQRAEPAPSEVVSGMPEVGDDPEVLDRRVVVDLRVHARVDDLQRRAGLDDVAAERVRERRLAQLADADRALEHLALVGDEREQRDRHVQHLGDQPRDAVERGLGGESRRPLSASAASRRGSHDAVHDGSARRPGRSASGGRSSWSSGASNAVTSSADDVAARGRPRPAASAGRCR